MVFLATVIAKITIRKDIAHAMFSKIDCLLVTLGRKDIFSLFCYSTSSMCNSSHISKKLLNLNLLSNKFRLDEV